MKITNLTLLAATRYAVREELDYAHSSIDENSAVKADFIIETSNEDTYRRLRRFLGQHEESDSIIGIYGGGGELSWACSMIDMLDNFIYRHPNRLLLTHGNHILWSAGHLYWYAPGLAERWVEPMAVIGLHQPSSKRADDFRWSHYNVLSLNGIRSDGEGYTVYLSVRTDMLAGPVETGSANYYVSYGQDSEYVGYVRSFCRSVRSRERSWFDEIQYVETCQPHPNKKRWTSNMVYIYPPFDMGVQRRAELWEVASTGYADLMECLDYIHNVTLSILCVGKLRLDELNAAIVCASRLWMNFTSRGPLSCPLPWLSQIGLDSKDLPSYMMFPAGSGLGVLDQWVTKQSRRGRVTCPDIMYDVIALLANIALARKWKLGHPYSMLCTNAWLGLRVPFEDDQFDRMVRNNGFIAPFITEDHPSLEEHLGLPECDYFLTGYAEVSFDDMQGFASQRDPAGWGAASYAQLFQNYAFDSNDEKLLEALEIKQPSPTKLNLYQHMVFETDLDHMKPYDEEKPKGRRRQRISRSEQVTYKGMDSDDPKKE